MVLYTGIIVELHGTDLDLKVITDIIVALDKKHLWIIAKAFDTIDHTLLKQRLTYTGKSKMLLAGTKINLLTELNLS